MLSTHTPPAKNFPPLRVTFLLQIQFNLRTPRPRGQEQIMKTELLRVEYCHENPSRERNNDIIDFVSFGRMQRTQSKIDFVDALMVL